MWLDICFAYSVYVTKPLNMNDALCVSIERRKTNDVRHIEVKWIKLNIDIVTT